MNTNNLRIGIIGSHGTGKTTLANELSERLNMLTISEIARKYNVNTTDRRKRYFMQVDILNDQMYAEMSVSDNGFISDRTTLDNLAYFMLGTEHTPRELMCYLNKAIINAKNYTHLFYIPIEFDLKGDGFRNTNKTYQHNIDSKILEILGFFELEYIVTSGSLEERVNTVFQDIEETT